VNITTLSEKVFNLNVSGSDDDGAAPAAQPAPAQPAPSESAPANAQTANPVSLGINNVDVQEGRNYTFDIHYFFEVTPTKKICKVCW
jgi:hypothetical protein